MSGCEFDKERLSAYLDGELSREEAADVREHLENCPECRELLSQFEAIRGGMRELEAEPPADLAGGIMDRVRAEKAPNRYKRHRFAYGTFVAAAAVVALVFLAGPGIVNNISALRGTSGAESADAAAGSADTDAGGGEDTLRSAMAPAVTDSQDAAAYGSEKEENGQASSEEKAFTAAVPAPDEQAGPSETSSPIEENSLGMTYMGKNIPSAPALPYSNFFSAILVLRGEVPAALEGYDAVRITDTESHIILPAEDLRKIKDDLDEAGVAYEYYDQEPNTSPEAENGIIVLYPEASGAD
ncbi:anti-sigma factor family protein [Papillibacter cinnamivorans]|uniref:Anti-sigma-W factor RsiW n=1 Tax=Papillibacter cinnamivorans DSM 12816 TaxID=1122930 RepID=A0A1W2BJG9_9FIRM|nr:zf-HC2 domain-containing protein [Papillibacter cinnamivorans]SMC73117.1 Anti sigma-E protein RseA, N-terminal domain [Papillibacter cinnamivorans DSM 12816]